MRDNEVVNVGPEPLSFEQVVEVARYGATVRLTDDAVAAMAAARTRVDELAESPTPPTASRPGSAPWPPGTSTRRSAHSCSAPSSARTPPDPAPRSRSR